MQIEMTTPTRSDSGQFLANSTEAKPSVAQTAAVSRADATAIGTVSDDRLISNQIAQLLESSGIAERRWAGRLADILDISSKTVRRKLDGESAFSTGEVKKILASFGYEYHGIYGIRGQAPNEETAPVYEMKVDFDGRLCNARVKLRPNSRTVPAGTGKVLIQGEDGAHKIVSIGEVTPGVQMQLIQSIEIVEPYPYEGSGAHIGVFDTDANAATSIAQGLYTAGFNTTPLASMQELWTAIGSRSFAAILLNWTHWSGWNPVEVGTKIRQSCPNVPIIFSAGIDDQEDANLLQASEVCDAIILPQLQGTQGISRHILREIKRVGG